MITKGHLPPIQAFTQHYDAFNAETNTFGTEQHLVDQQIKTLFYGSSVQRWHVIQHLSENTIGQHSHGVAMLCWLITRGRARVELIMAALTHDLSEQQVGDVPSPTKRALGISQSLGDLEEALLDTVHFGFELSPEEQIVLALADRLDGMLFCIREVMLGNRNKRVMKSYRNYQSYIDASLVKEGWTNLSPELRTSLSTVLNAITNLSREYITDEQ